MYYEDQYNINRKKSFAQVENFLNQQKTQHQQIKLPQNTNQMQQHDDSLINKFHYSIQPSQNHSTIQMNKLKSNGYGSNTFTSDYMGIHSGQIINDRESNQQTVKEEITNHLQNELLHQPQIQKQINKQLSVDVFNFNKQFSTQQSALQEKNHNTQQKLNIIQKSGMNQQTQISNKYPSQQSIQNTAKGIQDNKSQTVQNSLNNYSIIHQQSSNQEALNCGSQIPNRKVQTNTNTKNILGMDYKEQQQTVQPIQITFPQPSTLFFMPNSSQITQNGMPIQQQQQQTSSQQNRIKKHQRHYSEISTPRDIMQYLQIDNKQFIPSSNQVSPIHSQNKENVNFQMKGTSQHQHANQFEIDPNIKNNYYEIRNPTIPDPFQKINSKKSMKKNQNETNSLQVNTNQNKIAQYTDEFVDKYENKNQLRNDKQNTHQNQQIRDIGYTHQNTLPNQTKIDNLIKKESNIRQKHSRQTSLNIMPAHYQYSTNRIDAELLQTVQEDFVNRENNSKLLNQNENNSKNIRNIQLSNIKILYKHILQMRQ